MRLSPRAAYFIQKKLQYFECFIVFIHLATSLVLTKYTSLKFNAMSAHLLNKQSIFLDKNVLIVLLYSSIL